MEPPIKATIADGNIRLGGTIPVDTHGGNLSEAYIIGMTHIVECVEQIRGTAINQVPDCEYALCTGGPYADDRSPTSAVFSADRPVVDPR